MNRFEDVTQDEYLILNEIRARHFSELAGAEIKIVFDTKKRKSGGKIVLARIKKPSEVEKFLCTDPVDYIIFLDQNAWALADSEDRVRLIRHELRHTLVDFDSDNPYKLRDHSITDFYSEVKLNEDDPRWAERVGVATLAIYEDN